MSFENQIPTSIAREVIFKKSASVTWEEVLASFRLRCQSKNLSSATLVMYFEKLGKLKSWATDSAAKGPTEITTSDLRSFMSTRTCGSQTLHGFYRVFGTFFKHLKSEELIGEDPTVKLEEPIRSEKIQPRYSEESLKQLLAEVPKGPIGARDKALIYFYGDTGARLDEALGIRLRDLDMDIMRAKVHGKGGKERFIYFGLATKKVLQAWLRYRDSQPENFLFCNRFGERMSRFTASQRIKRMTKRAGIAQPRLCVHAFRHFFGVEYLKNGGDTRSLQEIFGHETESTTAIYSKLSNQEIQKIHQRASPIDKMNLGPKKSLF